MNRIDSLELLPVPALDEIPTDLRVDVKPNWHGVPWNVVGRTMVALATLGLRFAERFLDEYTHHMFGWTMLRRGYEGEPSRELILHEGVHAWQESNLRGHRLRVALDPRGITWLPISRNRISYRAHSEGAAYAVSVLSGRSLASAAAALSNPAYATGLSLAEAYDLISRYVKAIESRTNTEEQ